jgi:hypothetical protein
VEYNYILQQYPEWCCADFRQVDFADFYQVRIPNDPNYTVDYLGRKLLSYNPPGIDILVKIRDVLVKPFGLKTSKDLTVSNTQSNAKGSAMIYFQILERDEHTIVLGEKDKHLDFRILMRVENAKESDQHLFKLSTVVKYNNRLGQIYFAIIKPFHKYFVGYMIKKLQEKISNDNNL